MGLPYRDYYYPGSAGRLPLHAPLILYASLQLLITAASASGLVIKQTRLFNDNPEWQVQRVATVQEWDNEDFNGYWFECYKDNVPPAQSIVEWQRFDSDVIITSFRNSDDGHTRLEIEPDEVGESVGFYACIDTIDPSNIEYLNITDRNPGLVADSDYIEALAGSSVNLTVFISSLTATSMLSLVQWRGPPYVDEEPSILLEEPAPGQTLPVAPSTLSLSSVTLAMAGTYNLTVYVHTTSTPLKDDIVIDLAVLAPVEITSFPSPAISTDEWEEVDLVCTATGSRPLHLEWTRVGESGILSGTLMVIEEDSENNTVTLTNTLTFPAIRYDDGGTYRCTAHNSLTKLNSTDTADTAISVNHRPAVFITRDEIYTLTGDTAAIEASIYSLSGVSSILWYRDLTRLDLESDQHYSASHNDSVAKLVIRDFRDSDVGTYTINVTTNDNQMASDSVSLMIPEPILAVVDPDQLIVDVGGRVGVVCMANSSYPLEIEWLLGDGIALPNGVHSEGGALNITMATLNHTNTYTCTVSSPFSMSHATFILRVFDPLMVEIVYNNDASTAHELSFRHGDGNTPSFKCVFNGTQNALVNWQLSGGDTLPSGAVQNGDILTWTHRLEYTDSGVYECRVMDLDSGRLKFATVTITVIHNPVLDTIFPAPEITMGNSPADFVVPLEFTGTVLTCSGFAWPTPSIEWTKDSGALPRGVTAVQTIVEEKGIVVSELVVTNQFGIVDVGRYKCRVDSSGEVEEDEFMSQLVELEQGASTYEPSEYNCPSISRESVLFQIRVSTTNCDEWGENRREIALDFENLLYRVVYIQCKEECDISKDMLAISTLECSTYLEGGVVFRGSINTGSEVQTEAVLCALSRWQSAGSLVTIGMYRYLVDSQCPLQIGSYNEGECEEPAAEKETDVTMILMIVIPLGGIGGVVAAIAVVVVCFLRFCRCCKREKVSDGTDPYEVTTISYRQNPLLPRPRQQENPFYSETAAAAEDLDRYQPPQQLPSPLYDEAISPDRRPLFSTQPESLPKEEQQETAFTDSGVSLNITSTAAPSNDSPPHEPRQTLVATAAQPYQIPTASTSSLNKVGAANPLWGINEGGPSSQGEPRRFSEGPSSQGEPRRISEGPSSQGTRSRLGGCISCVSTHTTGLSSSTEDYSHLKYPPSKEPGTGVGTPPERKWYLTSEPSYSSLNERPQESHSYSYIQNPQSQTDPKTLPQRKETTPTAGEPVRGALNNSNKVPSSTSHGGRHRVLSDGDTNIHRRGAPSSEGKKFHPGPPRVAIHSISSSLV